MIPGERHPHDCKGVSRGSPRDEKRGCSMTTCPVRKMPNSKSNRDVAAALTKATNPASRYVFGDAAQRYAMLLKTSRTPTRQRQMCTAYARQQDIQQTKREQFLFSSLVRLCQNGFGARICSFSCHWSKTRGNEKSTLFIGINGLRIFFPLLVQLL